VQIAAPHWNALRVASQSCSARDGRAARIPLLALRAWMKRVSHASPKREREESVSHFWWPPPFPVRFRVNSCA
jgi:hypothetical protein